MAILSASVGSCSFGDAHVAAVISMTIATMDRAIVRKRVKHLCSENRGNAVRCDGFVNPACGGLLIRTPSIQPLPGKPAVRSGQSLRSSPLEKMRNAR
jgi:hypothetical protein